jgi:hypothetical protein
LVAIRTCRDKRYASRTTGNDDPESTVAAVVAVASRRRRRRGPRDSRVGRDGVRYAVSDRGDERNMLVTRA